MNPPAADTFDRVIALGQRDGRAEAADRLAETLGVETLLLLVSDPTVGALLPAPGFPPTLRGGPAWRELLERCAEPGRHRATVDLPASRRRAATAIARQDLVLVLLGGEPAAGEVEVVERLLPLVEAVLRAEQEAFVAAAESAEARETASRARALADALEEARAEAAALNAELREEDRRKDDFLAMLAHELRNPLAPLMSGIELLRRAPLGSETAEDQLGIMRRQVDQLARLVEDLLDVSRVSRGRIALRRERLDLRAVVDNALEIARSLVQTRGHEVEWRPPHDPLWVDGDPLRLAQVFGNLLHNAAKYTDPGGRIEVAARRDAGQVVVEVRDSGTGISPETLPRIFDLFVQAPAALYQAQGGLGIGLTLVRALVELHGGRVAAASPGLGQGSTFSVSLPLSEAAQEKAEPAAPARDEATPTAPSLRVLVVDDNEDAADSLAELLRIMGHRVEVAYSGLEAVRVTGDFDADLVLLDIGLPEMDGYEVHRRLRRIARPTTVFAALTGYGSEEDVRRSHAAGFDDHLVKPLSVETLEEIVERIAGSRRGEDGPPAS